MNANWGWGNIQTVGTQRRLGVHPGKEVSLGDARLTEISILSLRASWGTCKKSPISRSLPRLTSVINDPIYNEWIVP